MRFVGRPAWAAAALTRAVTYSVVFGVGYSIGLGLFFGLTSGIATGITLAVEFNRAARALALGAALYRILGFQFAIAFAFLIAAGQIVAYSRGMRPSLDYDRQPPSATYTPPVSGDRHPDGKLHCCGACL
jgi:hypothetical protein